MSGAFQWNFYFHLLQFLFSYLLQFYFTIHKWLLSKKAAREHNTKTMYQNIIEKHLIILDGIKLIDIRNSHFQLVISDFLERPLTESESNTVKNLLTTEIFTDKEKAFIYLIMGCGLRRQEALALQPLNFDFNHRNVSIRNVVIFDGNNPNLKLMPKSENGIRTIPVPEKPFTFLKQYCSKVELYLFTNKNGTLISKSGYDNMWRLIVGKINAGMGGTPNHVLTKGLTAHTFRHNYCTELCYQVPTISTKKIAALLGDKEKMVLEVYSHIVEGKEDAVSAVEKSINF